MHRLNVENSMLGALGAFNAGVARHRAIKAARQEAYDEAVRRGRERDAFNRRIRALEAQLAASQRRAEDAEVSRRLDAFLGHLKG